MTRGISGGLLGALVAFLLFVPSPARAACEPMPTDKGLVVDTVHIETAGQYTAWLRMSALQDNSNNLYLQVDDNCYVTVGSAVTTEDFVWGGTSDESGFLTFNLEAGEHTIKIAGHEEGVGLDKMLLMSDTACVPTGMSGECSVADTSQAPTVQVIPVAEAVQKVPNLLIITLCALVILGVIGFIVWKYVVFHKNHAAQVVPNELQATKPRAVQLLFDFCRHHVVVLLIAACLIIASIITGVVAAASQIGFEAESATLSNGAKAVDSAGASGGKYVLFEGTTSTPNSPTPNAPSSGTGGGGGSPGGNNPGGGTPNPGEEDPGGEEPGDEFPNASNTGPSNCTTYTQHSGTLNVTVDGTVLNCIQLNGTLTINANNVTVQNSILNGNSWWGVRVGNTNNNVTNFKLLRSKLQTVPGQGPDNGGYDYGISQESSGYMEIAYNNISGYKDGVTTSHGWIHDNYIHDLSQFDGAHTQDIYVYTGSGQVKIEHNTLINDSPQSQATAAVYIAPDDGHQNNRIVTNNLLAGGAYTIYGGDSTVTNIVITNNKFSTQRYAQSGYYGWAAYWWPNNSGNVWSGNTWYDGPNVGQTITP